MALIICPECGKSDLSDKASTCPNCGINIQEYNKKIRLKEQISDLAPAIRMPHSPFFSGIFLLDFLLTLIIIITIILFFIKGMFSIIIFLLQISAITLLQFACFSEIKLRFKDYDLAKKDFKKYQYKIAKRKIIKSKQKSYLSQYIISFLIPIIGIVLGAIFLCTVKKDDDYKTIGINCISFSLLSIIVLYLLLT